MKDTGRGEYYNVTLTTTDQVILPAGNRRRRITVYGCNAANSVVVKFGSKAVNGTDIYVPGQTSVQRFDREDVGSLIDQELHGISSGTAGAVIIVVSDP